jgi:hypothetical protein
MSTNDSLRVSFVEKDFRVTDLDQPVWSTAETVSIDRYWSGESAPNGRHFSAQLLWSDKALYVRFQAAQHEPLIISDTPDLSQKSIGLWDHDVCEIFVAPDANRPEKYFEFEVAPTGEWLDVALEVSADGRKADWEYHSGMTVASRVETDRVISSIHIPWSAFGRTPQTGDEWRGNLYRCVSKDPTRGYLAWQPTHTPEPSFHVPSKFGRFIFFK